VINPSRWDLDKLKEEKCEEISHSDIYQMFAYSHKFNCKKIILLYPWNEKINAQDESAKCERTKILKHYKFDEGRELYVATIDLMRDLRNKNEFNKLKGELKELFKSVE